MLTTALQVRVLAEQNRGLQRRQAENDTGLKTLHINYQRVVSELDAKAKEAAQLRESMRGCETSLLALKAELEVAKGYKEQLEAEVRRRTDLERTKAELQRLAMEAPGKAQEEANRLRIEIVQLKAKLDQARACEEGLRRQVEALSGSAATGALSTTEVTALRNEVQLLRQQLQRREAELEEAHDKLAIFLRAGGAAGGLGSAAAAAAGAMEVLDRNKGPDELRRELQLLREDYARLDEELKRALALLGREQQVSRELEAAKARLQSELDAAQREAGQRDVEVHTLRTQLLGARPAKGTSIIRSNSTVRQPLPGRRHRPSSRRIDCSLIDCCGTPACPAGCRAPMAAPGPRRTT